MCPSCILGLLVLVAVIFQFSARLPALADEKKGPPGSETPKTSTVQALTRAEIQKKLSDLAVSTPPDQASLKIGAMCYEMMASDNTAFFICPKCNSKTHLDSWVDGQIKEAQTVIESLKQISAKLDLTDFCEKCRGARIASESPNVIDNSPGSMKLIFSFPDESKERISKVTLHDMRVLSQFLSGSDRLRDERGGETPMKDFLARLKEILGEEK